MMKPFLASLALVLLIVVAPVVHAQNPVQDTIPQLQEWWRADNMKYGKYGMTWLDNFYNGKGALVVWTPNGVQTWQLRFPGDTQNVFTWQKGSANIKTGDFNGDGIIDYVDENSNIYQGIKNGEPPKTESIYFGGYYPEKIIDINGDGYEDVFNFPSSSLPRPPAEMKVAIGNKDISKMNWETIPMKYIDSNNVVVGCYTTPNKELRLICRRYFWHYEGKNQVITRDGYRLVRVWWEGNSFQSQVLDEFDKDISDGQGRYDLGTLLSQPNGKVYWLGASSGANLTVYNLSNDRLEKSNTQKYNGGVIGTLHHSIDNNASLDFYIWTLNATVSETCEIAFYSGDIEKGLSEISHFTTVQMASLISTGDVTGNGKADIALSNDYFPSFEKYRFSILTLKDTTISVIESQAENNGIWIKAISPMPISRSNILQMKVSVPKSGNYTLSLYDRIGKKITGKMEQYHLSGEQILSINIEDYGVSSGVYTLRLEGQGRMAQCSILIEE